VLLTVLNIVLAGDPGTRKALLNSALGQFPVIGSQLGHNIHGLQRSSVIGLVIGLLGLLWGSAGLALSAAPDSTIWPRHRLSKWWRGRDEPTRRTP